MIDRDEHYKQFENGASKIVDAKNINKYDEIGPPSSGHPLANDSNGSCYMLPNKNMDPIWDCHDSKIGAQELGFEMNDIDQHSFYRVDDNNPDAHNYRIATGHEKGANPLFTGKDADGNIDPEIYPGLTSGGQPEMVADQFNKSDVTISENAKKFDQPCKNEEKLSSAAEDIKAMPDGPEKQEALDNWNKDATALDERLGKCQDYVDSRCEDHRQTLENFGEGTKQHEIASNCLINYESYSQELGEAQADLRAQYASLNEGTEYNPSEPIPPHHKEDMTCLYGQSEGSGKDPTQLQGNEDMSCLYGNATGNTASVGQGLGDSVMNNNYGVSL